MKLPDTDLLSKLGLSLTPNLNELLLSNIWLHHPKEISSTGATEIPEELSGGVLQDSTEAVKVSIPLIPSTSKLEIIQPFNCFGNFVITTLYNRTKIILSTTRTGGRRMEHKSAPLTTSNDGIITLEIMGDIISEFHTEHGITLATGDVITINIEGKNALDDKTERNFVFKLA